MLEDSDSPYTANLIKLLTDSLRNVPPVAPVELCFDSQTKSIISELKNLGKPLSILDYGCGNLRLLQGLKSNGVNLDIKYFATDVSIPSNSKFSDEDYVFIDSLILRAEYAFKFDVIILMNVIHEISIEAIATIFEDVRRVLKPDGFLFLVDMSILPEGEPLALPFYSWEFDVLFQVFKNLSYTSKNGIPVVFLKIEKSTIPSYSKSIEILKGLVHAKRDNYSEVACKLHNPEEKTKYEWLFKKLSLSGNSIYDLGLLMLLSGHANYRLMEENRKALPPQEDIIETAIEILEYFHEHFHKTGKIVSRNDIFQTLGSTHNYERIRYALMQMSNVMGCFFFPIRDDNAPLQPSESIDAFDDYFSNDDIREMGLFMIQQECHNKMWP